MCTMCIYRSIPAGRHLEYYMLHDKRHSTRILYHVTLGRTRVKRHGPRGLLVSSEVLEKIPTFDRHALTDDLRRIDGRPHIKPLETGTAGQHDIHPIANIGPTRHKQIFDRSPL